MLNPPRLAELNSLVHTQSGVWALSDEAASFDYSDGDIEEENIKSILTNSTNLSSCSLELEEKHNDWASEYHLSPLRANLLRYLDLTHKNTVLELGCGCGALTRYLGEQGLAVDAIEGSQRRANLARIRCHDLSNVVVVTSNFFNLSLPVNHYDAIFLVGVMEYAGRFSPTDSSAEASVTRLLEKVGRCLTPQGVILIAIENRLGRKYLCGAGEDHYGTAFEGIHGYPNYSGIKTWSQDEWKTLLRDAKLTFTFHYPFPDYKLPSLVLNEHYLRHDPNAWVRLTGITSRDYHGLISPQNDLVFWRSAHQAGCLGAFANSFLIVAGREEKEVKRLTPFDFVQTSTLSRQPRFQTQTRRYQDSNVVEKVYLRDFDSANKPPLYHALDAEPWRSGVPLSNRWIQRLRTNPSHELFVALSTKYFDYLKSCFDKTPDAGRLLDLLPMNIMIAPSGEWESFDHEWATDLPIDSSFIFFRGLFYFFQTAQDILPAIYCKKSTWTLQEGLDSCFSAVGLSLETSLDKYIIWEETIQNIALKDRKGVTTRDFLRLRLSARRQTVQLFWASPTESFTENRSQISYISIGNHIQSPSFVLPKGIYPPICLRVDPGVNEGVFNIQSIRVQWLENGSSTCLQVVHPNESRDKDILTFQNIRPHRANGEQLFFSLNQDPQISWHVPTNPNCYSNGTLRIDLALKWVGVELIIPTVEFSSNSSVDSDSPRRLFSFLKTSLPPALVEWWRSSRKTQN